MSVLPKETRFTLALQAIQGPIKMPVRSAAKAYDIPESSLRLRIKGTISIAERRNGRHRLTQTEEEMLIRYILDLDSRGFPPRIEGVEDMANSLLATRTAKRVSKH